jgi:hypothetical protein
MHVQVEQIVASDETIPEQSASVILLIRSPILESENTFPINNCRIKFNHVVTVRRGPAGPGRAVTVAARLRSLRAQLRESRSRCRGMTRDRADSGAVTLPG